MPSAVVFSVKIKDHAAGHSEGPSASAAPAPVGRDSHRPRRSPLRPDSTGTGSGKSLAYIIPIVDQLLRQGSGRGIQAIIVYPMNALANSQYGELEKFLGPGRIGATAASDVRALYRAGIRREKARHSCHATLYSADELCHVGALAHAAP